ncbi:LytTR family DNA-binding domain-containing protein [Sphingomonadaceae bacterium OTU29LAMAA1]|nr:LytTR family DNA-binding domain-containing protein [Sphingomonadaceae bacterium OTU29LAMAA1]
MADRALSVLIVDDEAPARRLLRVLCAEADLHVAGEADCGEAALEAVRDRPVDILFLDIAMPGIGGMETARRLPRDHQAPATIFTTAFTAHALAAFDVGAIDYLLKPIEPDRLTVALTRARAFLAGRSAGIATVEDHLWVSHRGDLVRVDLAVVERVEAERDYVRLHVEGRSHLLRETMENIVARLPAPLFRRIHRSTIVRRDLIAGLRHEGGGVWSVVLADGATLRIGRSYLEDVREI